jgi:hypothetical protein
MNRPNCRAATLASPHAWRRLELGWPGRRRPGLAWGIRDGAVLGSGGRRPGRRKQRARRKHGQRRLRPTTCRVDGAVVAVGGSSDMCPSIDGVLDVRVVRTRGGSVRDGILVSGGVGLGTGIMGGDGDGGGLGRGRLGAGGGGGLGTGNLNSKPRGRTGRLRPRRGLLHREQSEGSKSRASCV